MSRPGGLATAAGHQIELFAKLRHKGAHNFGVAGEIG
jgi:hypothetical protein